MEKSHDVAIKIAQQLRRQVLAQTLYNGGFIGSSGSGSFEPMAGAGTAGIRRYEDFRAAPAPSAAGRLGFSAAPAAATTGHVTPPTSPKRSVVPTAKEASAGAYKWLVVVCIVSNHACVRCSEAAKNPFAKAVIASPARKAPGGASSVMQKLTAASPLQGKPKTLARSSTFADKALSKRAEDLRQLGKN